MRYVFVINGRSDKQFISSIIERQIEEIPSFRDYEIYKTKCKLDATRFVRSYELLLDEQVCFVACGGDGTINEVMSGLVGHRNKFLAIMAYGTGNDFVKYYPNSNFRSVRALIDGTAETIDAIKVNDRYSINVCNIGFEAAVARIANALPRNSNNRRSIYRKALLRAFVFNRKNKLDICIDGEVIDCSPLLLMSFANCKYVGGEFLCAPKATNNDGLMDFCVIRSMNLLKLLPCVEVYKEGKHLDNPKYSDFVFYRRAKYAIISADHEFEVCIDGEIMINSRFEIDLLPSSVRIIVPANL